MTGQEHTDSAETERSDTDDKSGQIGVSIDDRADRESRIDNGCLDANTSPQPIPTPLSPTPPTPPPHSPPPQTPIPPGAPTPQPKGGSRGFFTYIAIVLSLILIIGVSLAVIFGGVDLHGVYTDKDQVAVIYVQGMMIAGGIPDGFGVSTSESVCKYLRLAADDDNVEAIVLRVNSPGGSLAAAQEIKREIEKAKEKKPVVISMGDVAASAAYHISASSDRIVANPGTITGSIGVIWVFENKSGYYDEEGIDHWVAKSGEFKDMGADWRNLTVDEQAYADEVVMEVFSMFVDDVAAGRNMTREDVLNLSDGRIYTGATAVDLGLVDETGNMYDAIDIAAELGNITGEPTITYMNKPSLSQLLFGGEESIDDISQYIVPGSPGSARSARPSLYELCMLDLADVPVGSHK
ncbi:MAG: signal peptide peptidase SppA [Candidatus Methanogaster sp.]|uniref:Signal peptide peptidase SppA n=1 Tax=Candidatus Methanogaster sp. TaxID=3386292 RepID=A0AC61KZZ2_9EURY|nr:MAG: signal peptide peptidase SppA [ANME-2 cluster archaeon]